MEYHFIISIQIWTEPQYKFNWGWQNHGEHNHINTFLLHEYGTTMNILNKAYNENWFVIRFKYML